MSGTEFPLPSIASPGSTPTLTEAEAQLILKKHYGFAGEAFPLPSERDQNFLIKCNDGKRYVLKFANAE